MAMEMGRVFAAMGIFISVMALVFLGLYTISNLTEQTHLQSINEKEIRIEKIAEELGIEKKEVIEDKPFFKAYYEYTTSAGIYRAVFADQASLTSIVKID